LIFKGKVHKYGDNINTDEIIPARYLNTIDAAELASHCMEDVDADFVKKVSKDDVMVAGENFGCGSSREHAPVCIKAAGVSCVIASTFARIFYRNAINIGLPLLESREAAQNISDGDEVEVDLAKGVIKNLTTGTEYQSTPFSSFVEQIISAGGLMNYVKQRLEARG